VKLQIIAPVEGKSWHIGHTILVADKQGQKLIDDGVAIVHPTVTNPAPPRPCPCEDETSEPRKGCEEKAKESDEVPKASPKPKSKRRKVKTQPPTNKTWQPQEQ